MQLSFESGVQTHTAQGGSSVVVILLPLLFFSTLSAFWLTLGILTEKTYGFCIISLFDSFFFFFSVLDFVYKNLIIYIKSLMASQSRVGDTLACAQTPLTPWFQAPFFQGGDFGEA